MKITHGRRRALRGSLAAPAPHEALGGVKGQPQVARLAVLEAAHGQRGLSHPHRLNPRFESKSEPREQQDVQREAGSARDSQRGARIWTVCCCCLHGWTIDACQL